MPHAGTDTEAAPQVPDNLQLYVNDGPLDMSNVGRLKVSTKDLGLEELRRRYNEDGYIFVKGVIPREAVLKAREDYFNYLASTGVMKEGTEPVDGIFDLSKDNSPYPGIGAGAKPGNAHPGDHAARFIDLAVKAHTEDWYAEDFCKHPALRDFAAWFSGWGENTLGFKRTLLRNNVPGTTPIGVHYDQIFLRCGEPTSVTAWVPVGDIAIEGGGLIYLEKGHDIGQRLEQNFFDTAMEAGLTEEQAKSAFNSNMMGNGLVSNNPLEFGREHGRRWLISDYEAGDVVFHNPFAIHASAINQDSKGVIRLGTDIRFVDSSKPWDTRWWKHYELSDGL